MNLSSDYFLRIKGAKDGFTLPEDKETLDDTTVEIALRLQGRMLTFLDISRCPILSQRTIGGVIPQVCPNLSFLDISYTNCCDISNLCQSLSGLRALNIAGLELMHLHLQDLLYLDSLEWLSIRNSNVTDVRSIKDLACLRSLDLGETTLQNYEGIFDQKLRLEELFVDECTFADFDETKKDEIWRSLARCEQLKLLNIQNSSLCKSMQEDVEIMKHIAHVIPRPIAYEPWPRRVMFFEAVIANNISETHFYLTNGIDVQTRAQLSDIAFFHSVWKARCCFPKANLQTPFFVFEHVDGIGLFLPTALHLAIFFNCREVVKLLLYHGADRNALVYVADILSYQEEVLLEDRNAFQLSQFSHIQELEIVQSPIEKRKHYKHKDKKPVNDWRVASERRAMHCRDLLQYCFERNIYRFTEGMMTQKTQNWKQKTEILRNQIDDLLRLGGNIHAKVARRKANVHRRRQKQLQILKEKQSNVHKTKQCLGESDEDETLVSYIEAVYDTGAHVTHDNVLEHLPDLTQLHENSVLLLTKKQSIFETVAEKKAKEQEKLKRLTEEEELIAEILGAIDTKNKTKSNDNMINTNNTDSAGAANDKGVARASQQSKQRLHALRQSITEQDDMNNDSDVNDTTTNNNDNGDETYSRHPPKEEKKQIDILPKLPLSMFEWRDHVMVLKLCGAPRRYVADIVPVSRDMLPDAIRSNDSRDDDNNTNYNASLSQQQAAYASLPSSAQTLSDSDHYITTPDSSHKSGNNYTNSTYTNNGNTKNAANNISNSNNNTLRNSVSLPQSLFQPRRASSILHITGGDTAGTTEGTQPVVSSSASETQLPPLSAVSVVPQRRASAAFLQPLVVAAQTDTMLQSALEEALAERERQEELKRSVASAVSYINISNNNTDNNINNTTNSTVTNSKLSAKLLAQIQEKEQLAQQRQRSRVKTKAQLEMEAKLEAERIERLKTAQWYKELRVLGENHSYLFNESFRLHQQKLIETRERQLEHETQCRKERLKLLEARAKQRESQPNVKLARLSVIVDVTNSTATRGVANKAPVAGDMSDEVAEKLEALEWAQLRQSVAKEEKNERRLSPASRRAAFVRETQERALAKFEKRQYGRR